MGRYLIVAHQTAASPELVERVLQIAAEDTSSEFALLVPATPSSDLLTWTEGEARAVAEKAADTARARLQAEGIKVARTAVGDESPLEAIEEELLHDAGYTAIVICTFPPGISRWLGLDLVHQAQRRHTIPVVHVVAERRSAGARR